jgi:hypothetical protein
MSSSLKANAPAGNQGGRDKLTSAREYSIARTKQLALCFCLRDRFITQSKSVQRAEHSGSGCRSLRRSLGVG